MFTPKDSSQNFTGIETHEVTQAFAVAGRTRAHGQAVATEAALEKAIAAQASVIPLVNAPQVWLVKPEVANYGPVTFATIDWTKVGFTKASK